MSLNFNYFVLLTYLLGILKWFSVEAFHSMAVSAE
jgi:hypothetical protein